VKTALAFAALVLLAGPARAGTPTLVSAEALVQGQYAAGADASPEAVARLYVPEIGQEMMDPIRGAGAVNLGIDPRYGQDNWRVTGAVTVSATAVAGGFARVAAHFVNFGKPTEIDWLLTPAPDTPSGWRVWDITGPMQNDWAAFSMRELLNLPR
jgi:hypothetical protein